MRASAWLILGLALLAGCPSSTGNNGNGLTGDPDDGNRALGLTCDPTIADAGKAPCAAGLGCCPPAGCSGDAGGCAEDPICRYTIANACTPTLGETCQRSLDANACAPAGLTCCKPPSNPDGGSGGGGSSVCVFLDGGSCPM